MLKTVETHWKDWKNTHCIFRVGDSWCFHRKGLQWRHFSRAHQLKISRDSVCILDFQHWCSHKVQSPCETEFELCKSELCVMRLFSFRQKFLQCLVRPAQSQSLCCIPFKCWLVTRLVTVGPFRGFQHSVGLIVVFYCESGRGWNQALFAINVFQEWNLHWVWVRTEWSHRAFWSKQGLESRVKWFCCDVRFWMLKTVETHWKNLKNTHCIFGLGDSWRFHRKGLQWCHFSRAHQLKISRDSVCILDFQHWWSHKVQSPCETEFELCKSELCVMRLFSFRQKFLLCLVRPAQSQSLCCKPFKRWLVTLLVTVGPFRGFQHSVGLIVVFYCESGRGWNQALFAINVFQEWNLHWVWVRTEWSHRAFWSKQGPESRVKWFCCDVQFWMLKTVETHWKNLKNTHCIFGLGDSWCFHRKGLQWRHFSRAHQLKISRNSVCVLDFCNVESTFPTQCCWQKDTKSPKSIWNSIRTAKRNCLWYVSLLAKILAAFGQDEFWRTVKYGKWSVPFSKPAALLHISLEGQDIKQLSFFCNFLKTISAFFGLVDVVSKRLVPWEWMRGTEVRRNGILKQTSSSDSSVKCDF